MPKLERHDSLTGASFRKASRAATDQSGLPNGHAATNGHASTNGKAQDGHAAQDIEMGNPNAEVCTFGRRRPLLPHPNLKSPSAAVGHSSDVSDMSCTGAAKMKEPV